MYSEKSFLKQYSSDTASKLPIMFNLISFSCINILIILYIRTLRHSSTLLSIEFVVSET